MGKAPAISKRRILIEGWDGNQGLWKVAGPVNILSAQQELLFNAVDPLHRPQEMP